MAKFTKISNGYTLEIEINEARLLTEIDEYINEMQELKKEITDKGEDTVVAEHGDDPDAYSKGSEYMADYRYEYGMQKVYGDPESDFCTPDEIIADLNSFKDDIKRLAEGDGEELWRIATLKKNGTFKKTAKPTIREAINGHYWEDSYGWNTLVLRLEPHDDTHMYLELDTIVLHY